jgi:predicted alpha/beta-fold hydrolase
MTPGDMRAAASGHVWTIGPWLRHQVLPETAPPSQPWSVTIDDPKMGTVRLTGQLRHRSSTLLLVVHGLGSEIDAPYVVAAAHAADAAGFSCLRIFLRGADRKGEDFYHAGLTADLHATMGSPALAAYERVFVLGYSLGGHVTLRYAVDAPSSKVEAIVAVSAPLDLDLAATAFDRPGCAVYRKNVLQGLCEIYESVARRRPVPTPIEEARRIKKIRDWDDRVVAPRHGFRDATHYYRSVSVAPWLPQLRLRSLLLYAERDPMVPSYVVREAASRCSSSTTVRWIERGGHMGFPSKLDLGYGDVRGLENQIMSWFLAQRR